MNVLIHFIKNPHRESSDVYKKIEKLKMAKTVAEWRSNGGKIWDLNELHKGGAVAIYIKNPAVKQSPGETINIGDKLPGEPVAVVVARQYMLGLKMGPAALT